MRIWIVHQHAIPPIVMGPTRHFDLARKLIEQGHEVLILAGNYCHNNFLYIAEPYSLTKKIAYYSTVPFLWFSVPSYRKNSFRKLYSMLVFAFKLSRCQYLHFTAKPDVIIGSSPSPFAAFAAQKLATRLKVPFIYEIRDLWPATLLNLGKFKKYHPLISILQKIENRLLNKAKKVISVLPGIKDYLPAEKYKNKLIWLPNAVDVNRIVYSPPSRQEQFNIFYTGTFNIANDLETLLQAAKILLSYSEKKLQFKLIGDGPQKNYLLQLIVQEGIHNVEILPTVRKERVHGLLASADLCVGMVKKASLYQYGTSLNKITDYMAIARPIVFALDSPYSPITEANAGYTVPPENPAKLAEAIIKVASLSYEERQQLGLNGRKYAEQFYDMETIASRLIQHISASS